MRKLAARFGFLPASGRPEEPSISGEKKLDAWIGFLLFLAAIAFAWISFYPGVVGAMVDDAIYVSMARSFANNRALDYFSLFGNSWTRFPPFLPIVLAAVLRLTPPGLEPLVVLQLFCLVVSSFCGALCFFQLRRYGFGRPSSILIPLLVTSHSLWFTYSSMVMSDGLFLCLLLLAVPVIERLREEDAGVAKNVFLGSLLVAAAILTRYVGATLLFAAFLYLWRRPKRAILFSLACGLWLLPWLIFVCSKGLYGYANLYQQASNTYSWSGLLVITHEMAVDLWSCGFSWLGKLPGDWQFLAWIPILWALWRWKNFASLFAFVYLVVVIPYLVPFNYGHVNRFSLAIAFFVLAALWASLRPAFERIRKPFLRAFLVFLFLSAHLAGTIPSYRTSFATGEKVKHSFTLFRESFRWIEANVPPGDSMGAFMPPFFFIHTSRQVIPVYSVYRPRVDDIADQIRNNRLPYLVISAFFDEKGEDVSDRVLKQLAQKYPGKLEPLFNNGMVAIFGTKAFMN